MADWGKAALGLQKENPAAPEGLRQQAGRFAQEQAAAESPEVGRWGQAAQGLQPWAPPDSYAEMAQNWYGGQNTEGVNNGFDTAFMQATFDYIGSKEAEAGRLKNPTTMWDMWDTSKPQNAKATGVATWDDPTGRGRWKVGDVFEGGRRREGANLYEQFDRKTANLMMADFMFTADEKARIYKDSDPNNKLDWEVTQRTKEQTETAKNAPAAWDFSQDVQARQEDLQSSGASDVGSFLAGAGGGAALGSVFGPWGTVIGAGVGGFSAWLNRDQFSEVAARATEVTERAYERYGFLGGTATATKEYAQLANRALMPTSNAYQGLFDAARGELGDGEAEFYAVNEDGQRKAGTIAVGLDIAASFADSLLQFGSSAGRWSYMLSTGMATTGGVASLGTGGTFNPRIGDFDKYETPGEWAAAIGATAIDAAQMTQAQSLWNAANSAKARLLQQPGVQGQKVTLAGTEFTLDDQGRAIHSAMTLERFAPSEMLRYIPAKMKARTFARRAEGREMTHDDLYVAARNMTDSGSRWRDALMTGYTEGVEEGIQAALDPMAVSEDLNPSAIFEATLYGAAAGVGMGLGAVNKRPANAAQMEARARWNHMSRTGTEPTDEEWTQLYKGLSPLERERLASTSPQEANEIRGHLQFHEQMMMTDRSRASVFGAAVANDFSTTNFDAALQKINPAVDTNLILLGRTNFQQVMQDGTVEQVDDPNVAVMSAFEVVNTMRKKVLAHEAQLESATRNLKQATDPDERTRFQAQVDRLTAQIPATAEVLRTVQGIYDSELITAPDEATYRRAIDKMNNALYNAAKGQWTDANNAPLPEDQQELYRQAGEMVLSRHPWIDTGSFTVLIPQVSFGMTAQNTHASIGVHQGILKPVQGDHDGDRMASVNMAYLEVDRLRELRRGAQMAQTIVDPKTGADVYEWVMDDPDDEATTIREFSQHMWNPASAESDTIIAGLLRIHDTLLDRYTNPPAGVPALPADKVSALLVQFELDVRAGNKKARSTLLNGLLRLQPDVLIAHGDARGVPEGLWLQSLISNEWDTAQKQIAALGMVTNTGAPALFQRKPEDQAFQKNISRKNAANASTTLGILGSGDGTRDAQMLWYSSFYRAAINAMDPAMDSGYITQQQALLTQRFIELGTNESQTAFELVTNKHSIENRVLSALKAIHKSTPTGSLPPSPEALILLAQTRVPNLVYDEKTGDYRIEEGEITLLQLLLRKSLQVEKNLRRSAPPDAAINMKIRKLESMTRAQRKHSYSASTALLEIFGSEQLINLLGSDAKYLGQQMSLNQKLNAIKGMHEVNRNRDIRAWRSSPAYVSHHGKGDPPFSVSDYTPDPETDAPALNAFTMVVDALATSVNTQNDARADAEELAHKNMLTVLGSLKSMVDVHARDNDKRLRQEGKAGDRRAVLEDMLAQRQDVASILAPIIPDAIRLGAFEVINGRIHTANWVMEVLTETDLEKAALIYHVYSGFTEFNMVGGGLDLDSILAGEEPDQDAAGTVDPNRLKSQFAQTIYRLATESSGVELARFVKATATAPSLGALYKQINAEPVWRGNRAELMPYHQDISESQLDPRSQFVPNLPGAALREMLMETATRLSVVGQATLEEAMNRKADEIALNNMLEFIRTGVSRDNADQLVGLLKRAIQNAKISMDSMGQAARDQFLEVVQDMLARTQDKAKADPRVAPAGEWLVTADTFGLKQGWGLELDALTSLDWSDVKSNLTKLMQGPVRMQRLDGAEVSIDMTDPETLVQMLLDPRSRAFARAVLQPTVRDVNNANVLQHYADTDSPGSVVAMLKEASHAHLFKEHDAHAKKLKQATRYINFIEAAARQKALPEPAEKRADAFLPLTNTMSEFLTAYTHRTGGETQSQRMTRERLVIEVADALKAIASLPASRRPAVMAEVKARMIAHYQGDFSALQDLAEKTFEDELLDDAWQTSLLDNFTDILTEAANNLTALYTAKSTTTDAKKLAQLDQDIAYWEERKDLATANHAALKAKNWSDLKLQYMSVEAAINQYRLADAPGPGMTDQDLIDANNERKTRIRDFLEHANRKERFRDKDGHDLLEKLRYVTHDGKHRLFDETYLTREEWDILAHWAATAYISESATRSSSDVLYAPLVSDTEAHVRRYYDTSWGYLIDGLFNEYVLEGATYLGQNALYPKMAEDEVVKTITSTLLNPQRLGKWSDRIPVETLKARRLLQNASVGLATPVAGIIPKTTMDQVGVGWLSFAKPREEHFTKTSIPSQAGANLAQLIDPLERNKLENHFVRRVTLYADGQGVDGVDITAPSTFIATATQEVAESGLTVLQTSRLQSAVDKLIDERGIEHYTVVIEYVDVDKTPYDKDYANSIYFDGVGPGAALGSSSGGPIAQSIFGTGGWSKVGQQSIFDVAARGGSGFVATATSPLDSALALEDDAKYPTVAEKLLAKVNHMWGKAYDIGHMKHEDRPALYKLIKQRHVVVGQNAAGEKVVMWSAEYISRQANGDPMPFVGAVRLVPLNETVAATLLSDSTTNGKPDIVTRPELNAQDVNPVPSLDAQRLKRLGLERLGETAAWNEANSPLFGAVALPKASVNAERGAAVRTAYEEKLKIWSAEQARIYAQAQGRLGYAQAAQSIRDRNRSNLEKMLELEGMAWLMARLNIPFPQMRDTASTEVSRMIAKNLDAMTGGNTAAIFWEYEQGNNGDLAVGVLSPDLVNNDFEFMKDRPPVFGDVVNIKLDTFLTATSNDPVEAEKQAMGVIRQFADRGLTIALTSDKGDTGLRSMLTDWLQSGALGYRNLAESAHIFTPLANDATYGTTRQALLSTLSAVNHFTGHDLTIKFLSNIFDVQGANEGTTFVDFNNSVVRTRAAHQLLPLEMVNTHGNHTREPMLFNIPVTDLDGVDQMKYVMEQSLLMLRDPDVRKHIKSLTNDKRDPNKADPGPPVNKFRRVETPGGEVIIEPGVLSIDDAFDRLEAQFEAGEYPLGQGKELQIGQIIPLLAGDGKTIFFARLGYRIPKGPDMGKQLDAQFADRKLNVAIASNELNAGMTVLPPFTQTEDYVPDANGLSIVGQYDLNKYGKWVEEGLGYKEGVIKLEHYAFPEQGMSAMPQNNLRVTEGGTITPQVKKQAVRGIVKDFRSLFAMTGIDFRDLMIDFFWGPAATTPRDPNEFNDLWSKTERILNQIADNDYGMTLEAVSKMMTDNVLLEFVSREVNKNGQQIPGWQGIAFAPHDPAVERDPKEALALKLISSLLAPGVKLEHVIATPGLMTIPSLTSESQVTEMPFLFTDALLDTTAPKLREMLFQMANAHMPTDPNGGRLYEFTQDFQFHVQMQPLDKNGNPQGPVQWVPGWAQMVMPQPAEENSVAYQEAAIVSRKDETRHLINVMNGALAARLETARDPYVEFDRRLGLVKNAVMRFNDPDPNAERGVFWDMLTRVHGSENLSPWDKLSPMQWGWVKAADQRVGQYTRPIVKTDAVKWPAPDEARTKALELLTKLGLTQHMEQDLIEVDYLVRQFLGRPAPAKDQTDYTDDLTQEMYTQVVGIMLDNVRENMHPLHGGAVPMERKDFWRKVFNANSPSSGGWAPAASVRTGRTTTRNLAKGWDEWVTTLVGQMRDSNTEFHAMYRLDLDGMWHTYQGSTGMMSQLGISTDMATELGLMDPDTNEFYISLDKGQNALIREPLLLDTMRMSLDALAGYSSDFKGSVARFVPQSVLSEQFDRQKDWLRSKKIPTQEKMTFRQYMSDGAVYIESARATTPFFSGLVNMSIFTRLLNPALYVSAFVEVPARNAMEHTVNLLTGTHLGLGAQRISELGIQAGVKTKYNPQQIDALQQLARSMGQSNKFLALLYEDITFRNFVERGHGGKISGKLEWLAAASARVSSDPRFGMKAHSIAMRYLQGVLEYYALTDASFSIEQFAQKMEQNPLYVQEMSVKEGAGFSAHAAGMNRVAQVRSIKATALSQSIMSPIDAMTSSGSAFWNASGHLLKIPFLFTRFNANALMALTGLNGIDQMVAMLLEGRKKPGFVTNMAARVRGEEPDRANQYIDMSDVLEGLDLTRPFTRMAVTQTGLMAAMFMAQGLGLGGEDEEMRKRRALAKYLNGPLYLDPREMQNDFLTADAMFLDNFSMFGLNTIYEDPNGRSAVVPHWIIRQFTAPMMGMQKFFETGNVREIFYGFTEAVSVLPTSVKSLMADANLTAELLAQAAADEDLDVTIEAQNKVTQTLIRIAGVYEKALLENSFVNAVRNGADHYNRNPWLVPQTTETGDIVMAEGTNNMPLRTDALVAYNDEATGENRAAYRTRSGMDAQAHQYAENNLTFALLASLFTGQLSSDSTYRRNNMVVAEKRVPLPEQTKAEAEALILSAYGGKPQVELTLDEIQRVIKKKFEDADLRWNQSDVERMAEAEYAARSGRVGALTLLDADGKEVITKAGADSIYTSLNAGMIDFSSPVMQGVYIPWEMRQQIDEEWATELIQEGIDLGLTRDAASYRMRRLMNGDPNNPDVPGIRDLIYDNRISSQPEVKYNQLNMTFMIGPDGRPWATPFARQNVAQAFGLPTPLSTPEPGPGMSYDETRGKLVDDVLGINLGLTGLERKQQEPEERERTDEPLLRAEAKSYTPGGSGSAWKKFPRRSYGSSGGGYSSNARPFFQRMYALQGAQALQLESIGQINTNTPYVRRASVREERISSERGRLKQWQ
jgi:hypothetical protein